MYKIPSLPVQINCFHAFSTIDEGNMSFLWGEKQEVLKSRENFLKKCNIDFNSCVAMRCQHQDKIVTVNSDYGGRGMYDIKNAVEADCMITKDLSLHLAVLIADCLPVIIFDPIKRVLALLHCSWKTTELKLVESTINRLQKTNFGCQPKNMYAIIGPGVKKEYFLFVNAVQNRLAGWENFTQDLPSGTTSIDLVGYNQLQLERMGVPKDNITISSINTIKDNRFFSHYRDSLVGDKEGRFVCVVGMR